MWTNCSSVSTVQDIVHWQRVIDSERRVNRFLWLVAMGDVWQAMEGYANTRGTRPEQLFL
jgi:hypothetical protein